MSRLSPRFPFPGAVGVLLWIAALGETLPAQVPDTLRYSFFAPKSLPQKFEQQGSCVAVSGTVAVVGSPSYDIDPVSGLDCGAVKIYETVTGKLLHRLDNPSASPFGNFGESVAISGPIVVVGSCNPAGDLPAAGCVYVYDLSSETPAVPLFTLQNPDPAAQDQFGHSVAVDGDRVVVGAWMDDGSAANSGTVYIFDISSGEPELPQLIIPNPTPADDDNFGVSVAISGSRVGVAAYHDDTAAANAGCVYIFDLQSGTPALPVHHMVRSSPAENDCFGNALAMAGDLVAVGAECADSAAINSGGVVVFDLSLPDPAVPRLSLTAPVTRPNDYFGTAVGLSDNRLVVGCYRDDAAAENAGTSFIYDLASPTPAVPVASPDKPLPALADYFGNAVAISGTTVLVTAWHDDKDDLDSGCTYVYSLASGTPDTSLLALASPVGNSPDRFGSAVAVDGNLIVIGSPNSDAGASGAGRVSVHDLSASKPTSVLAALEDPAPDMDANFGAAVAISGTIVVVGGPGDDDGAEDTGRVYVYDIANLPDTAPVQVLRNPAPAAGDRFGACVAISGNLVVIGADADDAGAADSGTVYVFNLSSPTPWLPVHTLANPSPAASDCFGGSVSISGSRIVVGAAKDDSGAGDAGIAYVYDLAGGAPTAPLHVLSNPAPVGDDGFGNSVGISGNTVAVGASGKDTGASNAGVVYVFDLAGPTPPVPWQTIPNPDPLLEDRFGCSVAVSEPRVIVGCFLDNNPTDSGRAYSFNMTLPTPTLPSAIQKKSTSTAGDQFGTSVAVSGLTVLVGCPSDNKTAPDKGAAYVFGPAAPEIAVEVSGQEVLSGGSAFFGPVAMGAGGGGSISIDILNTGITNLAISGIFVSGGNAGDFLVSTSGMTSGVPADDDRHFTVTLNPSAPGIRATSLWIQNSDSDESLFEIVLSGQSLSSTEDTDGDGVNDVSELRMAALGFDWETPGPELVAAFQSYANGGGLFEPGRVQALRMSAPALTRNSATGQAKLVMSLLKSTDLKNYQPLPFEGPQATINPAGELEFHFSVPDDAAFYRLETK